MQIINATNDILDEIEVSLFSKEWWKITQLYVAIEK